MVELGAKQGSAARLRRQVANSSTEADISSEKLALGPLRRRPGQQECVSSRRSSCPTVGANSMKHWLRAEGYEGKARFVRRFAMCQWRGESLALSDTKASQKCVHEAADDAWESGGETDRLGVDVLDVVERRRPGAKTTRRRDKVLFTWHEVEHQSKARIISTTRIFQTNVYHITSRTNPNWNSASCSQQHFPCKILFLPEHIVIAPPEKSQRLRIFGTLFPSCKSPAHLQIIPSCNHPPITPSPEPCPSHRLPNLLQKAM